MKILIIGCVGSGKSTYSKKMLIWNKKFEYNKKELMI